MIVKSLGYFEGSQDRLDQDHLDLAATRLCSVQNTAARADSFDPVFKNVQFCVICKTL